MVIFTSIMHAIGYAALGMPLGILAAHYSPIPFGTSQIVGVLIFVCAALYTKRRFDFIISIFLIAGLVGALIYQQQRATFLQRNTWYQTNTIDALAIINDITTKKDKTCLWLTVNKTRYNSNQPWQNANDTVLLCTNNPLVLDIDDQVYLESIMCVPHAQATITKHELAGTAFFAKTIILKHHPHFSSSRWFKHQRLALWRSLQTKLSPATFHLFSTIFLGKTTNDTLQEELRQHFVRWGLAHYLARSGIHLIMILLLLNAFLRLIIFSYRLRAIIVVLVCLLYALLSWPSIPFTRAIFAICVYQGCHLIRVPIDSLHILHLTLLACLIFNPASLFFLDFQLTFALTYVLIIAMRNR